MKRMNNNGGNSNDNKHSEGHEMIHESTESNKESIHSSLLGGGGDQEVGEKQKHSIIDKGRTKK